MTPPKPRNESLLFVQELAAAESPIASSREPRDDHVIIKWVPCDYVKPCVACRALMEEEAATSRSESVATIPTSPPAIVVPSSSGLSTAMPAIRTANIVDGRMHEDGIDGGPSGLLLPEIACLSADDATEIAGDVDAGDASMDEEDGNTYQLISSDDEGDHSGSGQDPKREEHPRDNPRDAAVPPTPSKRVRFAHLQRRRSCRSEEDESESSDDEYRPPQQPLRFRNRRLQMKLRRRSTAKRARRN